MHDTISIVTIHTDDTQPAVRGGARVGAGRKSAFPGTHPPVYMDFTTATRKVLDRLCRRTKLSRNDVMAHLAIRYADLLAFTEVGVVYPGKANANVAAIRLPLAARDRLEAARLRTGKSASDCGEALVLRFGVTETAWPDRPAVARKRKRKRARRAE